VHGTVLEIENNRYFQISYSGTRIDAKIGFGPENTGFLVFTDEITPTEVDAQSVVVHLGRIDQVALLFYKEKHIRGLILASAHEEALTSFLGEEIGVALTGNEKIPYPILLTEGFGEWDFAPQVISALREAHGKSVFLRPKTQIRAGVVRPEIIIGDI
jgi:hypothetical protein